MSIDTVLLGKRLQELMKSYNETTYSLGEKLGLSPPTISRYTRGLNTPKMTTVRAIADYFDVNPDWLIGKSSNHFREEPIEHYGDSCFGLTVFENITYDKPLLSNKKRNSELLLPFETVTGWGPSVAVVVPDDAMTPYLSKGDLAVIELSPVPETQKFAAFHVRDSDLIIRKIIVDNKKVILQPSNLDFNAEVYHINDIQMIGHVIFSKSIQERFFTTKESVTK